MATTSLVASQLGALSLKASESSSERRISCAVSLAPVSRSRSLRSGCGLTRYGAALSGTQLVVPGKKYVAIKQTALKCTASYEEEVEEEEEEEETEEEIQAAYEKLYGKAFSGIQSGNDLKTRDDDNDDEEGGKRKRGRRVEKGDKLGGRRGSASSEFEERVIQVRRVTKVVKGGKQMAFRAVIIIGDKKGKVGVGVGKAKEVTVAVQKAVVDAKRHLVNIPMTKYLTFPHRAIGTYGAASVMLRPAAIGTGVIAGGAVRIVLELAGVENALGKELGSGNPLNNARAVLEACVGMKQFRDVARDRGIPMEELWK